MKTTHLDRRRTQHTGVLSDGRWSAHDREEWRPLVSFEGKYEVSSRGRFRVTATMQIKSQVEWRGYVRATAYLRGHRTVWLHQLVAEAFIGPRPDGQVVRHLDGNGLNNTPANLAYGTQRQNILDRRGHGTAINAHTNQERCLRGHPLGDGNVYFQGPKRNRACKECYRLRAQWKRTGDWDYVNKCHVSETPKERLGNGAMAPRPFSTNRSPDSEESNT